MGIPHGLQPQIAQLGRIKIGWLGEERKSGGGKSFRPPKKLDYFLITTNERDKYGTLILDQEAMDAMKAAGFASEDTKLRRIPIALLSDNPDEILTAQWAKYDGKRRVASCDGTTATTYYRGAQKLDEPEECACDGAEHFGTGWKLHGTFRCVVACGATRFGGFYVWRTTSKISIEQLWGGLLHIAQLTGGVLTGIPLQLVVRPFQVSPDGKPTTVYCVHLELRATDLRDVQEQALASARFRSEHAQQIRAAQQQYVALLQAPAGPEEDDDEQAEVSQEFHPEPITAEQEPPPTRRVDQIREQVLSRLPADPHEAEPPIFGSDFDDAGREPGEDDEPYEETGEAEA